MESVYFAADEATKTADILLDKAKSWTDNVVNNGYQDKLKRMYRAYHGMFYNADGSDGHEITFSGEQGELAQLPVNHFRNIADHMINMITSNRPTMEARATNTDYKSLRQTLLANNILDYYMREKRLEEYLVTAVKYAIVLGAGFIKIDWNSTAGEIYDYIEETKTEIREGDVEFSNLSPFDVVFDSTKENQNHDWVLIRTWKNKYALAAKYPEQREKILDLKTKSELEKFRVNFSINSLSENTDDVPVFEFFHKKDDSLPDGRYLIFLSSDIVLHDLPMPYRVLPVFRISAGDVLGTPYGYSPLFDLLPLQEAVNMLYSTVLTNQNAFGVQNIWVPPGASLNVNSIQGGLNIIESMSEPKPLNLTNTPKEIFDFISSIENKMETISGINSVTRGNADNLGSNPSGAAMALVQSMALQFMSGLQQSYVKMVENIGTSLIKILQDYANTPRLIAIAGVKNRNYMKQFTASDISNISRVIVDVGNPLARTTAGRVQMADQLLQYQSIKPQEYINIINTGKLEVATEDTDNEQLLMRAENEKMVDGEDVIVTALDSHQEHITKHKSIINDPDLRKDPELVNRVLNHIQEHINALRTVDPDLLMLMNQQPLQPMGMPTNPAVAPTATDVQNGDMSAVIEPPMQGQVGIQQSGNQIQGPGMETGQNLPGIPQVDSTLLPNPDLQLKGTLG
jgi:hypothetical protein